MFMSSADYRESLRRYRPHVYVDGVGEFTVEELLPRAFRLPRLELDALEEVATEE